jgi:hypothetical protein
MLDEYNSLIENETWSLVSLPSHRKAISYKWTYRIKYDSSGSIDRFKARLVARGFTQRYGIDFVDTFSLVAKFDSIRTLLSIVVVEDYEMTQFDVRIAFLHGILDEKLYMIQPSYFEDKSYPNHVCQLQKSIYGLRQASRIWNRRFSTFLTKYGLVATPQDPCVYTTLTTPIILLAIFVDDGLIAPPTKLKSTSFSKIWTTFSKFVSMIPTPLSVFASLATEPYDQYSLIKHVTWSVFLQNSTTTMLIQFRFPLTLILVSLFTWTMI